MAKGKKASANGSGSQKGGGGGGAGSGGSSLVSMLSVAVACFAVGYGCCFSTMPAPTGWFSINVNDHFDDGLGTLPPTAKVITVSIEPPIQVIGVLCAASQRLAHFSLTSPPQLIKGFLSPVELAEMQGFFMEGWERGRFKDVSKRTERNTSHMWLPVESELNSQRCARHSFWSWARSLDVEPFMRRLTVSR